MDFAKTFVKSENVITHSGIRMLAVPNIDKISYSSEDEKLKKRITQIMFIESSNNAAMELFHSSGSKLLSTLKKRPKLDSMEPHNGDKNNQANDEVTMSKDELSIVDCSLYPTQVLPPSSIITEKSLVVVFESFDSLNFVYAKKGQIFNNRNGNFHHNDFIGKPFGCKIRSKNNRGLGFVHLLKPTPELWARSLNHRTQIVHELDASVIVFHLNLQPNMTVCESGTGSGAMSHAILRTVAPFGKLHTYEFNQMRVKAAREEFESNGVGHLVTVHWRDVCGKSQQKSVKDETLQNENEEETMGSGGFDIGSSAAHAIFLDLPEPWLAIKYTAETLKPNGRLCSYSPCVEQSQKTVQKLKSCGFHSIRTLEVRLREHYVDEVTIKKIPTDRLPNKPIINNYIPGVSPQKETENNESNELESCSKDKDNIQPSVTSADASKASETMKKTDETSRKRKILCARPFPTIKGHTAFLTFATNGNTLQKT